MFCYSMTLMGPCLTELCEIKKEKKKKKKGWQITGHMRIFLYIFPCC